MIDSFAALPAMLGWRDVMSDRARHARTLFAGIAPEYEWMGAVLSFGQDARWRRTMVSKVNALPGSLVLDVASGTGLVARELAARKRLRVVQLDPSEDMLRAGIPVTAEAGLASQVRQTLGRAERLPFPDETFDAVTFTYLLRYVDDPEATMRELTRVLRPGGTLACLEFSSSRRPDVARRMVGVHTARHARRRRRSSLPPGDTRAGSSGRASAGSTTGTRSPSRCGGGRRPGSDTCGRA